VVWYYQLARPGSTRQNQNLVTESGFATKQEATAAEAVRRTEELVRQAALGLGLLCLLLRGEAAFVNLLSVLPPSSS